MPARVEGRRTAEAFGDEEIAGRLQLSVNTVETHVSTVLRKLQLSNRHAPTRSGRAPAAR